MRLTAASLATALLVLVASKAYPQAPETSQDRDAPDFRLQVFGDIIMDFTTRVRSYADLRSRLEEGLPARTVTDKPSEIRSAARALAKRIRVARARAKPGDLFTPTITVEFRKALRLAINADTFAAIMDENPGRVSTHINDIYPQGKPLSTVPPGILSVLPRLPDDVEYVFLGRYLILLDTRASIVLDRIPDAIPRATGHKATCQR
jgi:hypothetical protein